MREHEYRAWHRKEKRWILKVNVAINGNGDTFLIHNKWGIIENSMHLEEDIEIMQYSGIQDKTGKEIYEGDILRYTSKKGYSSSGIYCVAWDEVDCAFVCERSFPYNFLHPDLWNECEIVGNKFENPELQRETCK